MISLHAGGAWLSHSIGISISFFDILRENKRYWRVVVGV